MHMTKSREFRLTVLERKGRYVVVDDQGQILCMVGPEEPVRIASLIRSAHAT